MYLSVENERALAKEATGRLNTDWGLSQPAVAAYLALFRRPNPTLYWLHHQRWEQLDRYARAVDQIPRDERSRIKPHYEKATRRPWLKGVIATYLAVMVRRHGSEHAAKEAHAARAIRVGHMSLEWDPAEDDSALARRASRYLTTDRVLPTQAAVYRRLLTSGRSGNPMNDFAPGLSRAEATHIAGSDLRSVEVPSQVRRAIHATYDRLKRSHRWKKGIIATALAMTEHQR